jgi:hypothetical protein
MLTCFSIKSFARLYSYESGDLEQLLFKVRIFARMSPHSKVHAVNMHRRAGIITGMCGDGGNVCGDAADCTPTHTHTTPHHTTLAAISRTI